MRLNAIKSNITYAVGNIANSATLLLLVPLLVRSMPATEYGSWSIFEISITFLTIVINAGLYVGFMRHYWLVEDKKQRVHLFSTALWTLIIWGGIIVAIGTVLLFLGIKLDLPNAAQNLGWVLVIGWIESIFNLFLTLFRIQERAFTFVALSIGRMLLFLGVTILLLYQTWGVTGVLIARFGATAFVLIIALLTSREYIMATPRMDVLWDMARYGLPLLGSDIAGYILFASDRYVMQTYANLETVAIYTFAYKLATSADILVNRPFAIDWAPRRFKIAADAGNAQQKFATVLSLYLLAVCSVNLVVVAGTPLVYQWFAPASYADGAAIIPILLLTYIIFGLSQPLNIGIMLKDKTKYLPLIYWGAAILCLSLNFLWIPYYGMWGAAWATLIAYTTMTVLITVISLRLYPIRYRLDQISWIVGLSILGYSGLKYLETSLHDTSIYFTFSIKLGWLLFLAAVGLISTISFGVFSIPPQLRLKFRFFKKSSIPNVV